MRKRIILAAMAAVAVIAFCLVDFDQAKNCG
jgi:hypothetical protein